MDDGSLLLVSLEGDRLGADRPWRLGVDNAAGIPAITLEFADDFGDDFGALYTEATDDIVFRDGQVKLDVSTYEEFGDRRIRVRGTIKCP